MRFFSLGVCAAALSVIAAQAQTTESVSVTATRPNVQVLPDRTVYTLNTNIQSATASLSDVLKNLPSIDVDIQGNVSLRGDSHVTVLIDGKKSALLAGSIADALQQIPANLVERVEVITNPSAEFRAEGSAGVINIVLRKDREMVAAGTVRVNIGSEGRANGGVSGNIKLGKLRLNGAYGERRDGQKSLSSTLRTDGVNLRSTQDSTAKSASNGRYAMLGATTNVTAQDEVELSGYYHGFNGRNAVHEHNVSLVAASDVQRDGNSNWSRDGGGANFSYRHRFDTKDEEFLVEASHYTGWGRNGSTYITSDTATGQANYWQSRAMISRDGNTEFKASYTLPLPDKGKFKIGYSLQDDEDLNDRRGLWRDPSLSDWTNDTSFTNFFTLDRSIHAGYVSYERHFGRFGVMGGLRVEQDFVTAALKTTGESYDSSNFGFYPSTHLSYALTDTDMLRLSYSRRMNRPGADSLNPARYSGDAFNVSGGNPHLKPEQVDSFEASYRYTGEKADLGITGYYRATYNGITSTSRYISPTVVLTTPDNLARRLASGVEANLNLTLLPQLSLRANGTVAFNSFNPGPLSQSFKMSGLGWNIKGGADWKITPDDVVQLSANFWARQRNALGYNKANYSGDLGYKHSFGDGLASVFTINNLFDSREQDSVLESPGLYQTSHRATPGRIFYLGLVYSFGGAKDVDRPAENSEGPMPGGM